MKFTKPSKETIVYIICCLYILLFTYAAVSKLLDFENFQVQLRQSPLLSSIAGWVSWLVPVSEIAFSICLFFYSTRRLTLYASFVLMVMFSAYIYIILNYSDFVPCSCGGILESMDWTQHLIFNLVFVLLAGIALILPQHRSQEPSFPNRIFTAIALCCSGIFGIAIVAGLFVWSEDLLHHDNNFTRRFEAHAAIEKKDIDLKYNSYYFAGFGGNRIYLGNSSAPALITTVDTTFTVTDTSIIALDRERLAFRSVQVKVSPPHFYVMDGTVPCIFKGSVTDWKAGLKVKSGAYFELPQLTSENNMVFRITDPSTNTNVLGTMDFVTSEEVRYNNGLLQKQIDGVFDTDGTLLFSESLQKIVYVYYYRNEYIVTDRNLKLQYRGRTIDTTTQAAIKVAKLSVRQQSKMNAPPQMVNKSTAVNRNLLFVQSELPGHYESKVMWKTAAIVDVYNIEKDAYLFSFYVYNVKGKKMRKFMVTDTQLFALIGEHLVSYELAPSIKNAYIK